MVGPLVRRRLSTRPDLAHEPPSGDAPDVTASDLFVFKTDWATYYLHPGSHSDATQVPASVLNDMDAIVVERSQEQYEDCSLDDLAASDQYTDLIPTLLETPRPCPIYSLDLPIESMPTTEGEATSFLRWFQVQAALVFGLPAILALLVAIWVPLAVPFVLPFMAPAVVAGLFLCGAEFKLGSYLLLPAAPATFAYRSAVVAEKLETIVAPMVSADRNRRVNILVDFGKLHMDIGMYLQQARLRASTRWLHQFRESPYDNRYTGKALEFSFTNIAPQHSSHSDGLAVEYTKRLYSLPDRDS